MRLALIITATLAIQPITHAQDIFMTFGANGEIVFSDQPSRDAERLDLATGRVSGDDVALTVNRHEEIARMADELEDARLARTPVRTAPEPIPVVEAPERPRNYYPLAPYNRYRQRPPNTIESPPPAPPRQPFQPVFTPRSPALSQ